MRHALISIHEAAKATADRYTGTVASVGAGSGLISMAEQWMQRATTCLSFAAALIGFVIAVYSARAFVKKRKKLMARACAKCRYRLPRDEDDTDEDGQPA